MSRDPIQEASQGRSDAYLIVKRELFYRPNAQGYTGVRDLAGRYSLAEVAERFPNFDSPNQDGMYFVHEDEAPEFSKACYDDIKADHLQKKVARLTAALAAADALADAADRLMDQVEDGGGYTERSATDLAKAIAAYREATK